jgi:hypothetical protein
MHLGCEGCFGGRALLAGYGAPFFILIAESRVSFVSRL